MDDCIFCKIVKREVPAEIVYEDDNFLAMMDIHPLSPGHTLVIPKEHYRWVWDVPNAGKYFEVVKKIALAQKRAFNTDAVWSKIMGNEVPHAHIWLFPEPDTVSADKNDLVGNAEKIRKELA
jgi:histidine triad (HIT) family protein